MANKKERPAIENPLANMGLDEIVRGITSPEVVEKPVENKPKETKKRVSSASKRFDSRSPTLSSKPPIA